MSHPTEFRMSILDLLRLLSDSDRQIAYERDVPIASVPAELFCMWFDDQYHPESDLFTAAFTPRERAILAAFHQRFEAASDCLPQNFRSVADLHARAEWQSLMRAAGDALKQLEQLA